MTVHTEQRGHTMVVTIDRPERANALDGATSNSSGTMVRLAMRASRVSTSSDAS